MKNFVQNQPSMVMQRAPRPVVDSVLLANGIDGSRLGLIMAEKDAPSGSLATLTGFLNKNGIRAVPGYYGPDKDHVLRISNFEEAKLQQLITQEFPAWVKARGLRNVPDTSQLDFREIGEDEVDSGFNGVISGLRRHSGTISGTIYTASNLAYMAYAFRSKNATGGRSGSFDVNMFASAFSYFMGGLSVLVHGNPARGTENTYPLLDRLYAQAKETEKDPNGNKPTLLHSLNNVVKRYPWEVSSLANGMGVGFQLNSVHRRKAPIEMSAAYLFLTSYVMAALIPEKGGRSPFALEGMFGKDKGSDVLERLEDMEMAGTPAAKPVMSVGEKMADFVHEHPVQISGGVALGASAMSATAALYQDMPKFGRVTLGSSATFSLLGCASQLLASKDRGATFDSVVSAAADMIRNDPEMLDAPAGKVLERVESLAREMQESKDITHEKSRMVRGITARLKQDTSRPYRDAEECMEGFLASERKMLQKSPFVSKYMMREFEENIIDMPENDTASAAIG